MDKNWHSIMKVNYSARSISKVGTNVLIFHHFYFSCVLLVKLSLRRYYIPFILSGMAGFVAAGIWGAYKFRTRGNMSTSVFLMQLRVVAQGAVVGTLTTGLAFAMAKEYLFDKKPKEE